MEFKIGDIVRCTNVDGDDTENGVGIHSIITEITDRSWPIHAVDIDGAYPGLEVAYSESEIELVYRHNETATLEDKVRQLANKWEEDYNKDYSGDGWVDGLMVARQELLELLDGKSN